MEQHEEDRTQIKRSSSFKKLLKLPIWAGGSSSTAPGTSTSSNERINRRSTESSLKESNEDFNMDHHNHIDSPTTGNMLKIRKKSANVQQQSSSNNTATNILNVGQNLLNPSNISNSSLHPHSAVIDRRPTTSINRSESYKERQQKRQLRERRKTSDPNLSKSSDVDTEGPGLQFNNNSGSSSNSLQSLRSLDSPSNSLEMVTGVVARAVETSSYSTIAASCERYEMDSDMEAEPDPPDLNRLVSDVELKKLSSKEKKRQEVINELFHTERSHVRALKVLDHVFYRPLKESNILGSEQLNLLFPNLQKMLEIHSKFNNEMKAKRRESPLVGDVSDILLAMFDGPAGEEFQKEAATFCAKQHIALESLKEKRRKEPKLQSFLAEAEMNPLCRRLQLKDIIPTGMQRLTKYPLIFENLVKLCEVGSAERAGVQRALDRSKEILNNVNQAVREAEDFHRLSEINRRLDTSLFYRVEHTIVTEYRNLDLTKHRLIYEGTLGWRHNKQQKPVELHVLLLEELIILLQKQDEKYVLKFHTKPNVDKDKDSKDYLCSPLIKVSTVLVRPVATDKKAFFLVCTGNNLTSAHIYELVAMSTSEGKTWFRHISEATDAYKMREGRSRKSDVSTTSISSLPSENAIGSSGTSNAHDEKENETVDHQSASGNTPAAPESTDSGFQDNADMTPSSVQPSDCSSPEDMKKAGLSGLIRRSSSGRSSGSIDVTKLVEEAPLIQPSEVVICTRDILLAEPVLTPIERLRREDENIAQALRRKQDIVAEILHIPPDQFDTIVDIAGEPCAGEKETSELALACFHQVNRLTALLNESLRVSEEEAVSAGANTSSPRPGRHRGTPTSKILPSQQLQEITQYLNSLITQMIETTKKRDKEREDSRREMKNLRETLYALLQQRRSDRESGRPARRATTTGLNTTSFLSLDKEESNKPTTSNDNSEENQNTDLEPSQEEFVDAISGVDEVHSEQGEENRPTSP